MPHMCMLDIQSAEWTSGVLHRTRTLVSGGDCCDFHLCKKGSKWDRERR
nr:L-2-amino-thiazoline-4-carboxylic acid hydrolase [Acetatifactor aquisgranensis]